MCCPFVVFVVCVLIANVTVVVAVVSQVLDSIINISAYFCSLCVLVFIPEAMAMAMYKGHGARGMWPGGNCSPLNCLSIQKAQLLFGANVLFGLHVSLCNEKLIVQAFLMILAQWHQNVLYCVPLFTWNNK